MQGNTIRIAVDFDGVICAYEKWIDNAHFGSPIIGAREFMQNLFRNYFVIINSCRCNEELNSEPAELSANRIRKWLNDHLIPYDQVWCGTGKVLADLYVDDRAVVCRPQDVTNTEREFSNTNRYIREFLKGKKSDAEFAAERKNAEGR